jgi:conjugative relaxase-like TrwC/TraI family protein
MLSIQKLRSSAAAVAYYLATVPAAAAAGTRLLEPDGQWLGGAAGELGLEGTVQPGQLNAVLSGRHPVTGAPLLPRRARRDVVAYDCTFSSPKSVSLLATLGPDTVRPAVLAAHGEAVAAAVGYLEREAARTRTPTSDGWRSRPADGLLGAAFIHRASRAPDPHLHTHVVVANLVPIGDGNWRSLDARRLYAEATTVSALYETHLRFELGRRAEVRFRPLEERSWADVAGLDPAVLRAFSRRSREISDALSESQLDKRAARIVAVATRPPKDLGVALEDRVEQWRERGYRAGLSASALARTAGRGPLGAGEARASARQLEDAVTVAVRRSRDGSFSRSDLLRARCVTAPEGIEIRQIELEVDDLLSRGARSGDVIVRGPGADRLRNVPATDRVERYTTRSVLEAERRLVELVAAEPERFGVLAYPDGDRLSCLDRLSSLRQACSMRAVAPGAVAASSFEALTGIRACNRLDELPSRLETLLVVDAHALRPLELAEALAHKAAERVLLVAPTGTLSRRQVLSELAAVGRFEPPGSVGDLLGSAGVTGPSGPPRPGDVLRLSDAAVVLASGPAAAVAIAADVAKLSSSIVTAGERSVLAALRFDAELRDLVVAPAALKTFRGAGGSVRNEERLVVVGSAPALRLARGCLDGFARTHVIVGSSGPGGGLDRGRAAELVRAVRPGRLRERDLSRRVDLERGSGLFR